MYARFRQDFGCAPCESARLRCRDLWPDSDHVRTSLTAVASTLLGIEEVSPSRGRRNVYRAVVSS